MQSPKNIETTMKINDKLNKCQKPNENQRKYDKHTKKLIENQ